MLFSSLQEVPLGKQLIHVPFLAVPRDTEGMHLQLLPLTRLHAETEEPGGRRSQSPKVLCGGVSAHPWIDFGGHFFVEETSPAAELLLFWACFQWSGFW